MTSDKRTMKGVQQTKEHSNKFPSLDLAFEISQNLIVAQQQRINAIDTKANFVFGAATGLVGTGLIMQSVLLTNYSQAVCSGTLKFLNILPLSVQRSLPLLLLLFVYIVVLYFAYISYKVRDFHETPDLSVILQDYLDKDERETKAVVFQSMVNAYERNEYLISKKAAYTNSAFVFLMIEAAMFVVLIVFQSIC